MEVKERIVEGAGKLFVTEGIRRVTMDYIAKRLAVSKRTIYELFNDKTELLKKALEHLMQRNEEQYEEMKADADNVLEVIVASLRYGVSTIKEISPAFFEDLETHYPAIWNEKITQRRKESFYDFQELVSRGIQEGMFRPNLNVKMVAKIFVEQMNAMNRKDIFPPDEYPTVELFETLFINFIRGVCTLEGIQHLEDLLEAKSV
jgi:TetR/AcrR family transcriptional regulator, cholesterol catabolism regulator